ncbi:MAG: MltA domain-containing protein [Rickettsiales bacterium]|jgi:membrane-bound lytic murein transglycosylase A|nr:MltA domain-containing protein [Rickettsiales bacterium]
MLKKILTLTLTLTLFSCGDLTDSGPSSGATRTSNVSKIPSGNLKPVRFSELPGWRADDVRYALRAFRATCAAKMQYAGRVQPDQFLVMEKCKTLPNEKSDVATVRAWFESNFQPYKIYDAQGKTSGLFTGYYSPVVNACRTQTSKCSVPIMDTPTDGRKYKGVDSKTLVRNRVGRVIYWIDPIDLQDMGSATLILEDGTKVKVSVASTNDLPFNGIGAQLQKRGVKPDGGYNMKSVRKYLKEHRALANELIDNNPRYVYYRQAANFDVVGKMGVPLSKIRSIAMDTDIYTLGMPVWVDTYLSTGEKFQRLMVAQDTGGAINGWVRADIYFGVGDEAFEYAHGQYSKGEMYMLMPKVYEYVKPTF